MISSRVHKRQKKTRANLLAAAHRLMSDQGVGDTTIQQITAEADVGFGTFYSYFGSKDEIAAKVLDCVIHNLGLRNRRANMDAGITDPVAVISNSVRLTALEMMTNPMWRWWLRRTDLMAQRMNVGFRPFGIEDMRAALADGHIEPPGGDVELAWNFLIWILAGNIFDIVEGNFPPDTEKKMADAVLRVLGVPPEVSQRVSYEELPKYPELSVDFNFTLGDPAEV